jgi:hypothetical protein
MTDGEREIRKDIRNPAIKEIDGVFSKSEVRPLLEEIDRLRSQSAWRDVKKEKPKVEGWWLLSRNSLYQNIHIGWWETTTGRFEEGDGIPITDVTAFRSLPEPFKETVK